MTSSQTPDFSLWDAAEAEATLAADPRVPSIFDQPADTFQVSDLRVSDVPITEHVASSKRPRSALSSWAMSLAAVGVVGAGACAFLGLESVDVVSRNPLGDLLMWFTALGLAGLISCVAAILAILALARGSARLVPGIALFTVVLVGPLATYTGLMAGLDDVKTETSGDVAKLVGDSTLPAVVQTLLTTLERTGR